MALNAIRVKLFTLSLAKYHDRDKTPVRGCDIKIIG
jgi:hypothetical protein